VTLLKTVPARKVKLTARWCKKSFLTMSPQYRNARRNMRDPMDSCYWCKSKFEDGDSIALASLVERKGNKVFCQGCAAELEEK
jgi:hypothetical protein